MQTTNSNKKKRFLLLMLKNSHCNVIRIQNILEIKPVPFPRKMEECSVSSPFTLEVYYRDLTALFVPFHFTLQEKEQENTHSVSLQTILQLSTSLGPITPTSAFVKCNVMMTTWEWHEKRVYIHSLTFPGMKHKCSLNPFNLRTATESWRGLLSRK